MNDKDNKENQNEYISHITQSKKEELKRLESAGNLPRRVKVYLLNGEDWIDNGTGFCTGEIDPQTNIPYFLVKKENQENDTILKSYLEGSIQYQRQQETLIVWTDSNGTDLALSFQETEGCADLCDFIIKVQQGNISPHISLYYVISNIPDGGDDITEFITGPIRYPPLLPSKDNLISAFENLNQGINSQFTRSNISDYIIDTKYCDKLIKVYEKASSGNDKEALCLISDIYKILFAYNEPSLVEDLIGTEERILALVGIFEYDSEYPESKADYKSLFEEKSFKTVIPVNNLEIFKNDFYLNTLKDVILARFLDNQTFSTFNTMIYANQMKIFEYLKDANVLEKVFEIYEDKDKDIELKRDGLKMLHQYLMIAKSLQKSDFFTLLVNSGLFKMIIFALQDEEDKTRILGTELIVMIIDQDITLVTKLEDEEESLIIESITPSSSVREGNNEAKLNGIGVKSMKADANKTKSHNMGLISTLGNLLANDKNIGLKMQAYEAIKTLLDANNNFTYVGNNENDATSTDSILGEIDQDIVDNQKTKEDNRVYHYFESFYTIVAPILFEKVISNATSNKSSSILKEDETLYQILCELVSYCSKEHDISLSRPFIIEHNILEGFAKLLSSNCKKVLKLHIVRCIRDILLLNDNLYTQYILKNRILNYLIDYFKLVSNENSLSNSTFLDFLESIIRLADASNYENRNNFKLIATYLIDEYREFMMSIDYIDTGQKLITLVDNKFNEIIPNDNDNDNDDDDEFDDDNENNDIKLTLKLSDVVVKDVEHLELIKTDELVGSDDEEEILINNASTPISDEEEEQQQIDIPEQNGDNQEQVDTKASFKIGEKRPRGSSKGNSEDDRIENYSTKKSSRESSISISNSNQVNGFKSNEDEFINSNLNSQSLHTNGSNGIEIATTPSNKILVNATGNGKGED
ncbi:PSY2 [Candida jiufengensis]|uniref:PSY2 n=1 Tax=Candida jiufengensis TaxID=497108 RepID=UPI002224076F|nr:PSY2 [Candida jiufengensis]KAI5953307.1 PSY2 [Candida jiufengensis]